MYSWTASIRGPPDSPYAHHRFQLNISVPSSYPHAAPHITFVTPCAHPNIHPKTGEICLDLLKDSWTPVWTLESTCRAISALLGAGDASSPLNCDIGNLVRSGDIKGAWSLARFYCEEYGEKCGDEEKEADKEWWKKIDQEEKKRK